MNKGYDVLALWRALSGWESRLVTTGKFTLEDRQREAVNLLRIVVERDILPSLKNDPLVPFWSANIVKTKREFVEFVSLKGFIPEGEDWSSWFKRVEVDPMKETADFRGIYFFLDDNDGNFAWGVTSGGKVIVCRAHFMSHPTEDFCTVIKDCEVRGVGWDELEKGDFPVVEMIECLGRCRS